MTDAVRAHPTLLVSALVVRVLWELLPMQVPAVVGLLVDGLSEKGPAATWPFASPPPEPSELILMASAALAAIGILQALAAWGSTELAARLGLAVVTRVRSQVFRRILSPIETEHSSGDLLDRALRDTARIKGFVDRVFIRSVTTAARALFPIVMLFVIDVELALMTLAVIPVQQGLSHVLQQRMQHASRAASDAHAVLTGDIQAKLSGRATIHALDAVEQSAQTLDREAQRLEARELDSSRLLAAVKGVVWVCTSLGTAVVWLMGSRAVVAGELSLGTLVTFTGYAAFVFRPFRQMTNVLKTYRTGLASIERIAELMETQETRDEDATPEPPMELRSWIREQRGLRALYGNQGTGKSQTLRALLKATRAEGRPGGYVPERPAILEDSLEANLRLANARANRGELQSAAELAGLGRCLDLRFEGERAREDLSTCRRVGLAQALLRSEGGPVLFDEPTSGLDEPSAEGILASLRDLSQHRCILAASHDPRVAQGAERVWQMPCSAPIRLSSESHRSDNEEKPVPLIEKEEEPDQGYGNHGSPMSLNLRGL